MPHDLIAIVDDDEAIRLSTCGLLQRCGYGVQLFKSGDDFLASTTSGPIACILLDMRMAGSDGLAVLLALRDRGDSPPVIVITGHGEIPQAVRALNLGAYDFMEKPYKPADLLAAIESAMASRLKVTDALTVSSEAKARVGTLTERQRQVLQGILQGLQNKVIAYDLGLSIRTIEAYRAQLLAKLDVRGTAEAVRLALAAGMGAATSLIASLLLSFIAASQDMLRAQSRGADLEQLMILTTI
jgi:two-component system response regulator FixJ